MNHFEHQIHHEPKVQTPEVQTKIAAEYMQWLNATAPARYVPATRESFTLTAAKVAVIVGVAVGTMYLTNHVLHHLFDDGAGEGSDS